MRFFLLFIATVFITSSCEDNAKDNDLGQSKEDLSYATGFSIIPKENYTLVQINTPYKNAERGFRYVLYPRNTQRPTIEADVYIPVPVQTIVCTSTTHIPLLDYLDESDKLIGFPTLDFISSGKVRERIDKGLVAELGIDNALNLEKLIELNPELVMGYTMSNDFGQFNKIQEAGIPVLINAEYMEPDPLGRAEWIKLAGLLFGKEEKADSVFSSIAENYNQTKELANQQPEHPTVLSGIMYSDAWYLPGGKNYAAKILSDAGCNYIWANDSTEGFLTLSYETVLNKAAGSDLWLGAGNYASLTEMKEANERYTYFDPFKTEQVYSYNKRIGAKGGSEFLELGYLRPDLILKDLVKIAHPNAIKNHELFFYFKLPVN